MPAEWEPHDATWMTWPHNAADWPGKFAAIPWVFGEMAKKITCGEALRILVNSQAHEKRAQHTLRRVGLDLSRVEFFRFPTNRGWTRDTGPIFIRRDGLLPTRVRRSGAAVDPDLHLHAGAGGHSQTGAQSRAALRRAVPGSEVAIARFRFNAWARYPDWEKDDAIPERAARVLRCRLFRARANGRDLVLEGGSIEVNGRGTLLTTEECLLDPLTQARNPGLDKAELEAALRAYLGVTQVLWLARGIAGDDTHGHVDDLCRFVGPRRVVLCHERNPHDVNYRPLEENRERLEGMRAEDGSKLKVVLLPMPAPLSFDGQRLPASYANFYVSNSAVLVPTFNDPTDRVALGLLAELFPDRPVVGIHAVDLVWGLGTLHCLTQQQPAR